MRPAFAIAAVLLAAAGSPAAEIVRFPEGRDLVVAYADLDGDGRAEILRWQGRRLMVHFARASGYDVEKPRIVEIGPDALFFGIGQVDADAHTQEIVLLTPRGVEALSAARDGPPAAPWLMVAATGLLSGAPEDRVHPGGFLADLDGDGLPDVAAPVRDGFAIHYQGRREGEGGAPGPPGVWAAKPDRFLPYRVSGGLSARPGGFAGTLRGVAAAPDLLRADFDGDGRSDLAIDDGETLAVHRAGPDGRVAEAPAERIPLLPLARPDGGIPEFLLADVTGDRKPEFIVPRPDLGRIHVHVSGAPLDAPPAALLLDGFPFPPRVIDLDGDGRLDLFVPQAPDFDLPTALSAKFSGGVAVGVAAFLNTGDPAKPFAERPSGRKKLRITAELFLDPAGRILRELPAGFSADGDFDGDGRRDLVVREGRDELSIYPGTAEGVFSEVRAPPVRIPAPGSAEAIETTVADLDADGRPDVALLYRGRGGRPDRLVLVLGRE